MSFSADHGLEGHGRKLAPGSANPPRGNLSGVEGIQEIEVITRG
jgi:hypothetical protein